MAATSEVTARLADWQSTCLGRVKACGVWDTAATDAEIANVCGVSAALVGKWRRGEATMAGYHLAELAETFGASVVLDVRARPQPGRPMESAADLQGWLASFLRTLVAFEADGLDAGEAGVLRGMLTPARALLDRVSGQLDRIGRRAIG